MAYMVGISGGSGSGKTTLGREVQKILGFDRCKVFYQDSYYLDQADKFDGDGGAINFDHPDSLDFKRMLEDLKTLKQGHSVQVPVYNFATHRREAKTQLIQASDVILLDGILIYTQPQIVSILDKKIFMDTPEDIRFSRRLQRDVEERGRTPEGIKAQLINHVKPMHDKFVEPSQKCANKTYKGTGDMKFQAQEVAAEIINHLRSLEQH